MRLLQDELEQVLTDAPYRAVAALVATKLANFGIALSSKEMERLVSHIRTQIHTGSMADFQFRTWQWWRRSRLSITITEDETREILRGLDDLAANELPELIASSIEDASATVLRALREAWTRELQREARELRGFEDRLLQRWGHALDRLRMVLTISRELGQSVYNTLGDVKTLSPHLVDVLARSHARACQIAEEIICLLASGLADGAMARWRTLHEIAAVGLMLKESGEPLAERYIAHHVVESFRAATDYRACHERLGYKAMPEQEYEELRHQYAGVVAKYGPEFGTPYGWAAEALGKKKPTLRDIELAAGVDHLRAHYRMASHNVHANPHGVFFKLGLLAEGAMLLAGRSNAGLADPGHSCAISLLQVTSALCSLEPCLDSLVGLRILALLTDEIGELFAAAHRQLAEDAGHDNGTDLPPNR